MSRWSWILATAIVLGLVAAEARAQVFVVESPSNVRQIVTAAHHIAQERRDLRVVVRTTEQVLTEDEGSLRRAVAAARVIALGRAFGDVAQKLARVLAGVDLRGKTVFVVYSDAELMRLTRLSGRLVFEGTPVSTLRTISDSLSEGNAAAALAEWQRRDAGLEPWIRAAAYVLAKGPLNFRNLLLYLLALSNPGGGYRAALAEQLPTHFIYARGNIFRTFDEFAAAVPVDRPLVALVDYDSYFHSGDVALIDALAAELERAGLLPLPIVAAWGEPTHRALTEFLREPRERFHLTAIVSLQGFVLGGDQARDKVAALIRELGVPVFRAIRLPKRSPEAWKTSEDGIPWASVYYQVAMPELQGTIEPILVGAEKENRIDAATGARIATFEPIDERIRKLVRRVRRWHALQTLRNAEKRVAIVYYNHPPGKQNIGADYLNVPASILELLTALETAGYDSGDFPRDETALLDVLLARGINVGSWAPGVQREVEREAFSVRSAEYARWLQGLSAVARAEVREGPMGYIRELVEAARDMEDKTEILTTVRRFGDELNGFVESFDGDQTRVLNRVAQLRQALEDRLGTDPTRPVPSVAEIQELSERLQAEALEGVSGWGIEPGSIMVSAETRDIVVPGVRYGNVFLGPQPQRGWKADVDTLHSSTVIPPHHQYLAFYYYIHEVFKADVVIHVGRHSSYEWLPRKQVALAEFDFPDIVIGDLPAIYLYTVDGVGEGLQAKRRGLSVIVDHLIPPLKTTELYGAVLELQQLVEQYEAQDVPQRREAIARELRVKIDAHHFASDLGADVMSYGDDKLVHTVGHYLEELKNTFLPYGLHTFGKPWQADRVDVLVDSMLRTGSETSPERRTEFQALIHASFGAERDAFLRALEGRFVEPGKGNDPIRTPEALPTGRNFYAMDASVMPTRISYELSSRLVSDATALRNPLPDKMAAILWAVETVRDEGTMVSFVLQLLGVRPEWDVRGRITDLRAVPLKDLGRPRVDVVVTTSGLFRDLFGQLVMLLDKAYRVALASSYHTIVRERPALARELDRVLKPLERVDRYVGDDPLAQNHVARHWVAELEATPQVGGELALARIFGPAEGAYGAGLGRIIEQAWTWDHRGQVSDVYLHRMSHVYSAGAWGVSQPQLYRHALRGVDLSFHSRATNLYGVVDNDDYFDYFGGLSMAIETVNGRVPGNYVLFHADPERSRIEPLERFLTREMRTRYFNPEWIAGMMREGYSGARTVSNKFVEFTWGWQVTNPDIIRDWMWNEVVDVYVRDKYDLGVTEWLSEKRHAAAMENISAILLTAAAKGFWRPTPETLSEVATTMGTLVARHGPGCSAHVCGDLHTQRFAMRWMNRELQGQFAAAIAAARGAVIRVPSDQTSARAPRSHGGEPAAPAGGPLATTAASGLRPAMVALFVAIRHSAAPYTRLLLSFGLAAFVLGGALSVARRRFLAARHGSELRLRAIEWPDDPGETA